MILTAEQLRAARALLRWEQSVVAERSGISVETVKRLEKLKGPLRSTTAGTVESIRLAFAAAGVTFSEANGKTCVCIDKKAQELQA